jgi:hypothetical protein
MPVRIHARPGSTSVCTSICRQQPLLFSHVCQLEMPTVNITPGNITSNVYIVQMWSTMHIYILHCVQQCSFQAATHDAGTVFGLPNLVPTNAGTSTNPHCREAHTSIARDPSKAGIQAHMEITKMLLHMLYKTIPAFINVLVEAHIPS